MKKQQINELQNEKTTKDTKINELNKTITELNNTSIIKDEKINQLKNEFCNEKIDLENKIQNLDKKIDISKLNLDEKDNNIQSLKEEIEILKSIINEKDETINLLNINKN